MYKTLQFSDEIDEIIKLLVELTARKIVGDDGAK